MPFLVWGDADRMIDEIEPYLPMASLISLDHVLEPVDGGPADVGVRVMVAKELVPDRQTCPVIIHSSNGTRAEWMAVEFEPTGWDHRRVAPIGERWIEEYWKPVARDLHLIPWRQIRDPRRGPPARSRAIPLEIGHQPIRSAKDAISADGPASVRADAPILQPPTMIIP